MWHVSISINIHPTLAGDLIDISSLGTGQKSKKLDLTLVLHVVPAALSSSAPAKKMFGQWASEAQNDLFVCCLRSSKKEHFVAKIEIPRYQINQSYVEYCLHIAAYMNIEIGRFGSRHATNRYMDGQQNVETTWQQQVRTLQPSRK